jgi:cytochrome P450
LCLRCIVYLDKNWHNPILDGRYRCDLVELADLLFLNFGANLIGFQNMDEDDLMERLRELVPAVFAGILAQFFEDKQTINRVALDAKQRSVDEFYMPARDHHRDLYRRVEAGEIDEADVPRTLMRLLVTEADPAYTDEELAIREALMIFNTAVGISTQAVVNMVNDLNEWFARDPEDYPLCNDLEFLTRRVQETVRLKAPFISFLVREAAGELEIGDRHIHKGDELHIEIARSNQDPAVFGHDASEFNPWRKSPDHLPRYGIAFGSGPHACLGLRVVLGNDAKGGSHVRFMQTLFGYDVKAEPDGEPLVLAMAQDESSMGDIPTFVSYPVVFTNWSGNNIRVEGSNGE